MQNITNISSSRNSTFPASGGLWLPWTFLPVFFTTVIALAGPLNTFVAVTILANRDHLQTPFNIYLSNLCVANAFHVFLAMPLDVLNGMSRRWVYGRTLCTFYRHINASINSVITHSHLLITINRIWAVTFPLHYRNHHNKRVSFCSCAFIWIYPEVVTLYGMIMDHLYYRLPEYTNGCEGWNRKEQKIWNNYVQYVLYFCPVMLTFVLYPYVWCRRQRRFRAPVVAQVPLNTADTGLPPSSNQKEGTQMLPQVVAAPAPKSTAQKKDKKKRTKGFLVLSLCSLSLLMCWGPGMVFFPLLENHGRALLAQNRPLFNGQLACLALFSLQSLVDPCFLILALKGLQDSLWRATVVPLRRCVGMLD